MNGRSVEYITDIMGGVASPVDFVGAGVSFSHGEVKNAIVSGISGLQAMGATASKVLASAKVAAPVWCLVALNDFVEIKRDLDDSGKVDNEKILGALSTASSAIVWLAVVAAGSVLAPPVALGLAATFIVASTALSVAALAANPNDKSIHYAVINLLTQAQSLAEENGLALQQFFDSYGGSGVNGIDAYGRVVTADDRPLIENKSIYRKYSNDDFFLLGSMIGKLDPTITFTRFEAMIKAGSKDATSSYEGVLDAVRKLVLGPQVKDTAIPLIRGGAAGP